MVRGVGHVPQMRQRFGGPGSGSQTSPLLRGAQAVAGSSFVVVLLHLFEEPTSFLSLCGGQTAACDASYLCCVYEV